MYKNARNEYLQNLILTASPKKLIDILFETAIKHLKVAEYGIENDDYNLTNNSLIKVQNIILELKFSVNSSVEGNISNDLIELYDFMFIELVQANIDKDKNKISRIKSMLEELHDGWQQI